MRKDVTKEQAEAAKRLQDAFKEQKAKSKDIAEIMGITPGALSHYLTGKSALNMPFLLKFCGVFPDIDPLKIFPEMFEGVVFPIQKAPHGTELSVRTPLTNEELGAANKLKTIFANTKELHGLTYNCVGEKLGIPLDTVNHYFNGSIPLNMEFLIKVCSLLPQTEATEIFPEVFKMPSTVDPHGIFEKFYALDEMWQDTFLTLIESQIHKPKHNI